MLNEETKNSMGLLSEYIRDHEIGFMLLPVPVLNILLEESGKILESCDKLKHIATSYNFV